MMCEIYFGKINQEKRDTWKENSNPYDILTERFSIKGLSGWDFLAKADKLFSDKHQVDWGSFAYRCTKEQLLLLQEQTNCEVENIELYEENAAYAVVFIEIY